jgi:hypothetical protein
MSDKISEANCNIVKDLLPLYVDGALSAESKVMVEEHLQICKECSRERERMERDMIPPVATENITAPINSLKKSYFKSALQVTAIVVVFVLVCCALVESWLLRPALQGFELYDENKLTVSEEDGHLVLTPDADAAARKLYYIYQLHEDDTITVYVSYGTTEEQYKSALFEHRSAQKMDWQIEPDGLLITKEDLSMQIVSTGGGERADGTRGGDYVVDDIAAITFSEQVKEIYYAPALTQEMTRVYSQGMNDEWHEYADNLTDDNNVSMGESVVLLPTTFFDFSAVESDGIKMNTTE